MTRARHVVSAALFAVGVVLGCDRDREKGSSDPQSQDGPTLVLLDSVTLAESDSLYVGLPAWIHAAPDGTYLIPDPQTAAVYHFAGDGRYVKRFGRRGKGPGEFSSPGRIALDDSLVYVSDEGLLEVFNYRTGEYVRQLRTGKVWINSLTAKNGRVFFDAVDRVRRSTVAAVGPHDTIKAGGPFPPPLGRSQILDQFLAYTHIAALGGDTIAVAVQNNTSILVGSFDAGTFTAHNVPARVRRGAPDELIATISDDNPAPAQNALYKLSVPSAIGRLPNGQLAYIAADEELVEGGLSARLYVSVIEPKTRKVCRRSRTGRAGPTPMGGVARRYSRCIESERKRVDRRTPRDSAIPDPDQFVRLDHRNRKMIKRHNRSLT